MEKDARRVPPWLYDILMMMMFTYGSISLGVRAIRSDGWLVQVLFVALAVLMVGAVGWHARELVRLSSRRR